MEKFASTPELLKRLLHTDKNITIQTWQNWSDKGSCHVSNALENHESTIGSHNEPCRIPLNTSQHQKVPCKSIWFRNYFRLVVRKVINNIMTKHAYLPTTIIFDKRTVFMSQIIKELAEVLGITLQQVTTKHAQTIGMLERTQASLKKTMKIKTGEISFIWHKYVNITVSNYNTSYHTSTGCEPSGVFHGRVPFNVPDLKSGNRPQRIRTPNLQIAEDVLKQTDNKAYYNKKANALKLKEQLYV